nr:tRNA pseudouridine(38-40) synthase TruA [bacterium]
MLEIEYDGTAYAGWQRQNNGLAVQQCVEEALARLTGENIRITGASRTDAGVHARMQIAHFDTECAIPADKFCYALNTKLPDDIRVTASRLAPEGFHSRFCAKIKTYRYCICARPHASAIYRNQSWHVFDALDDARMDRAARQMIGTHDFCAFQAAGASTKTTVRTVERARVWRDGDFIYLEIAGNGFLYNMVRILAGTLALIGAGRLPEDVLARMIATGDRTLGGPTAPPQGLVLWNIELLDAPFTFVRPDPPKTDKKG